MRNALFSFTDRANAQRAVERLAALGLPAEAVQLHVHDTGPGEKLADEVDEAVTGGLLTNLYNLVEGLFDWGSSRDAPRAYAETLHGGGAVVSVSAREEADQQRIDEALAASGFADRTAWTVKAD